MKLPLSLIKSFISIDLPLHKLGETLTLLGIEVDRILLDTPGKDPLFELSLTPNLGHCMSALGIARELSASLQIPLHSPKIHLVANSSEKLKKEISVADPSLCPRYSCRLIEGVKIGPSPVWLQETLESCGLKSISNAVDALNYILLKWGQPLHGFDFDLLEGNTIEVTEAVKAEKFLGLDGEEREIPSGTILIRDAEKTVAIAGILGSADSALSPQTTRILLEAALFNPLSIRTSAKKLGLRTESSQRFEKGVDPHSIETALNDACQLIVEICGGRVAKEILEIKTDPFLPKKIHCRRERANQILGTKLSLGEMKDIFHRLGFRTQESEPSVLLVDVPFFRFDVSEEIDLIEELARIYGYSNIEKGQVHCTTSQIPHDPVYVFEKKVRRRLLELGLQEFLNCDLISPKLSEIFSEITSSSVALLQAIYSKSEEYSILRTSLLPGFLQAVKKNFDQKNQTLEAFELGRIHFIQKNSKNAPSTVVEIPMAALLITGASAPSHWSRKCCEVDFFDLKGLVENLTSGLDVGAVSFLPSNHLSFHPGRQADIQLDSLFVGSLGEIHPTLLEKFDIKQRVFYAEIHLQHLLSVQKNRPQAKPLSQFPASERDWTLSLKLATPIGSIFKAIHSISLPLLEKAELIDLFIPENSSEKKATFRFIYRDNLKTISLEEIETEHAKLIKGVSEILQKTENSLQNGPP